MKGIFIDARLPSPPTNTLIKWSGSKMWCRVNLGGLGLRHVQILTRPLTGCVTLGQYLFSLSLFICKMGIAVIRGHYSWTVRRLRKDAQPFQPPFTRPATRNMAGPHPPRKEHLFLTQVLNDQQPQLTNFPGRL